MNGNEALDAQFEEVSQGAMADLIILSKSDLAKSNQVKNFEDRLGRLNP
ncbi:MAG: GTP-binding protein, partial [Pseudomonadota bacterium]